MVGWTVQQIARYVGLPVNNVTSSIQGGVVCHDVFRQGGRASLPTSSRIDSQGLTGHNRQLARLTLIAQRDYTIWNAYRECSRRANQRSGSPRTDTDDVSYQRKASTGLG